jgi:excisionase family DNA binding protein
MTDMLNPFRSINLTVPRATALSGGAGQAVDATDLAAEGAATAEGPPVVHTVAVVARTLGISARTVGRRIREGVIRKVPIGRRLVRISSAELQRLATDAA